MVLPIIRVTNDVNVADGCQTDILARDIEDRRFRDFVRLIDDSCFETGLNNKFLQIVDVADRYEINVIYATDIADRRLWDFVQSDRSCFKTRLNNAFTSYRCY